MTEIKDEQKKDLQTLEEMIIHLREQHEHNLKLIEMLGGIVEKLMGEFEDIYRISERSDLFLRDKIKKMIEDLDYLLRKIENFNS